MDFPISSASREDVEKLIEIYSSPASIYHSREEASWFVKSFFDYHHIKVVKQHAKVVGAAFWNVVEERHHGLAEIVDLWIEETCRRRGLGEKLLGAVIEDMKRFFAEGEDVLRKVLVTTGNDNEPAKRLYEKVGFEKIAVLADLFGKGEDELVYVFTCNP